LALHALQTKKWADRRKTTILGRPDRPWQQSSPCAGQAGELPRIARFAIPRIDVQFFIENWYLFLLAVGSGALLMVPALKGAGAGSLTPADAVQRINREKAVVVDVREAEEYVPATSPTPRTSLAQLEERLPQVAKNKSVPVVLVCEKGARAVRAEAMAKKLGYEKAQALAGGMKGWRDAGMPVEKA
jgi:rhodanese-related sulfurtransferase